MRPADDQIVHAAAGWRCPAVERLFEIPHGYARERIFNFMPLFLQKKTKKK